MDINFMYDYVNVVTLGICLCIGYAIKQGINSINNRYIPAIMLVIGVLVNCVMAYPKITGTVILGGMISGLASTGLYEAMRNLINKDGKKE